MWQAIGTLYLPESISSMLSSPERGVFRSQIDGQFFPPWEDWKNEYANQIWEYCTLAHFLVCTYLNFLGAQVGALFSNFGCAGKVLQN